MIEKNGPVDINGKAYNRTFLIIILLIGAFCTILNQTLLATALPDIMKDFDITAATGQWLTSGFLLMNGVMIPLSAPLINKINSKTLYISAMGIFLLGTITAALAPNFSFLLTGRIIQALGAGIMMPLMQTISLLIVPREKRGFVMGLGGLVVGFAPAIGPTLSGWIVDQYNWRVLFDMMIPIVFIVIILSLVAMKKVVPLTNPAIDYLSVVLSTIGFGGVLYGFSSVGNYGWSNGQVIWPLMIGCVFIALFIWRQLVVNEPMLELRVFKSPIFTLSVIISSVVMMALIGAEIVLPLYIQNIRGESAFYSGLFLLPGALVTGLMSPITGIIFDRIGARKLSIIGIFLLTVGTVPFMFLTEHTGYPFIVILYALRLMGVAMVLMPITTAGMNALPDALVSHGTAVNNTIRTVAGSIGTAILISVLTSVTNNNSPGKALMHTNPSQYAHRTLNAALTGMNTAFMVSIGFCLLTLVLTFFIHDRAKLASAVQKVD